MLTRNPFLEPNKSNIILNHLTQSIKYELILSILIKLKWTNQKTLYAFKYFLCAYRKRVIRKPFDIYVFLESLDLFYIEYLYLYMYGL